MRRCCWRIFPGRNAGASLKPNLCSHRARHQLIFPGRNAGASLKHGPRIPGYPGQLVIFPGRNAGASLKLFKRGAAFTICGIFPGRNAGASLKRH